MEASAVPRVAPTGATGVASPQLLRLASDARLVALVRQGWPAAFEAVYNRHQRGILSFCRHVLSDADEAEDAVQHTFLAAYNDLITSDKPIHLRAWLFTIARNRCYSILRARREQPAADLDEPVTEGLATQVQRRQDLRDLVVDLRGLPDEQRAALVLAELDALSHEEIGQALGVPRDKVKALVFQARESLVASRTARETACADIREQLSNGRGGTLRRANLRRHLRDCSSCRDFRRQVERQRRQIAALLPVVPTVALKESVLTGTGSTGAGFSGGGLLASTALKSGVLKGFATLALATAGTAGTYVATHDFQARTAQGTAGRPHPTAAPAGVRSTVGLRPTGHTAAGDAPSIDHAAPGPPRSRLDAIRLTGLTAPVRAGHSVLKPFAPLVHSRTSFPGKTGSRLRTIAPPASKGRAPTRTMPPAPPAAAASTPSATTTSSAPTLNRAEVRPAADIPSTGGEKPAARAGIAGRPGTADHTGIADHPRGVGRSAGASSETNGAGAWTQRGGDAVSPTIGSRAPSAAPVLPPAPAVRRPARPRTKPAPAPVAATRPAAPASAAAPSATRPVGARP
ncbi:MAG: RNA polymerase sigma factor, partial [Actinomycetota bacterium]|nr:RNA polymerase sigma factor [Actinomycetota bacterium]